MDDKNLYPAMIGKLREMLADHADDIASATDRFIESLTQTNDGKDHD